MSNIEKRGELGRRIVIEEKWKRGNSCRRIILQLVMGVGRMERGGVGGLGFGGVQGSSYERLGLRLRLVAAKEMTRPILYI